MLQAVNAVMLVMLGRLEMADMMHDAAAATTNQGQEVATITASTTQNVASTTNGVNGRRCDKLNNATNSLFFVIALIEAIKMGFVPNEE